MTKAVPTEAEVRAALDKVLSSAGFTSAGRLGGFLRHLVERTLAGGTDGLKESVLGLEVFERPADFDPRVDPVVRVEARRLRSRLDEYYMGPGAADAVRIRLPKGGYVPVFEGGGTEAGSALAELRWPQFLRGWRLAGVVAGLAVVGILLGTWQSYYNRRIAAAPAATVAVLPFENVGADPENEYFSQGLTEEITDRLSQVAGLKVVPRSVAARSRAESGNPLDVARRVGASVVVEGSVRRQEARLRVVARLLGAADGASLWSQTYERPFKDVFAVQDEIARSVAAALRVNIRGPAQTGLSRRYTDNLEAYNALLKARYQLNLYSTEGYRRSIDYFNEALRLQSDYAPALAGRSLAYLMLTYYKGIPQEEGAANARASAERAIALDPESAEAYASLGQTLGFIEWRWAEAEKAFHRALALDANSAMAHGMYAAAVLMPEGRLEEAHREFKTALDLDPLLSFANFTAAFCLLAEGRYAEAVRQYERTLELKNIHPDMYWDYGMALGYAGRTKEAAEAYRQSRRLRGSDPAELKGLEAFFSGDPAKARRDSVWLERDAREGRETRMDTARLFAMLGEKAKAIEWLEQAVRAREPQAFWIKTDPRLKILHGDPRWAALVREVGLPLP